MNKMGRDFLDKKLLQIAKKKHYYPQDGSYDVILVPECHFLVTQLTPWRFKYINVTLLL